jgi:hypothetical protein
MTYQQPSSGNSGDAAGRDVRAHVFAAERIHADDTTAPVLALEVANSRRTDVKINC